MYKRQVHNHLIEEAMGDLTGQKLTDATGSLVPVKDEEGASSNWVRVAQDFMALLGTKIALPHARG